MKLDEIATRAAATNDVENVIYVANFADDKGFAILAADDRIKEKVIAVADKSNLSKADVAAVVSFLKNKETYIDSNYPTTGNGLFTAKDYPDEVFLNPNTFSTYDETQNDNWVGNFSDNDNTTNTRAVVNSEFESNNDIRMPLAFCSVYAMDQLMEGGGVGGIYIDDNVSTTYSDWKDIQRTNNLLSAYSDWWQGTPFNDYYPGRRKYMFFGRKRNAPAGCFPLTLAKIMTKFEKPQKFIRNEVIVDWNALDNVYSPQGRIAAAALLKGIAEWCGSMYFYGGTFTFPSKASSFLKDMGFKNVNRCNYGYDRVTSMIDNDCPVIIYGVPGIRVWNSHAWIIDGYKIKVRQKITKRYRNNNIISTSTESDTCRMVHCDFGWYGHCNGYYVEGVFKLNSDDNDYDYIENKKEKIKYNHHVRIIRYAKPI